MKRTCESLEKGSTKYSFKAEAKLELQPQKLLLKANPLKRRQNELKVEVKGLKDKIKQKMSRRSLADEWLFQYILC